MEMDIQILPESYSGQFYHTVVFHQTPNNNYILIQVLDVKHYLQRRGREFEYYRDSNLK